MILYRVATDPGIASDRNGFCPSVFLSGAARREGQLNE